MEHESEKSSAIQIFKFSNSDEASNFLSSTYAPIIVEPNSGREFDFEMSAICLNSLQIYRSQSETGLRFRSLGYYDGFTFSTMRSGAIETKSGSVNRIISIDNDLAIDAGNVDSLIMSEKGKFRSVALDAYSIKKALTARLGDDPCGRIVFCSDHTSPAVKASYEAISEVIYSGMLDGGGLQANPLAIQCLEDALLNVVLYGARHNYSDALARGTVEVPKVVRRAMDYIQANAHLPISSAEVASVCEVGLRSLQLSFQRWLDMTPHQYLRSTRLRCARAELSRGGSAKVRDVARKWGFNSPGEFARLYSQAFGERPNDTKR